MVNIEDKKMDKIVSLCKRRGFIFPSSQIYGGLANSWDFGPLGIELKNNIKSKWWEIFVQGRSDIVGIDSAIIMNSKVWEASGHLSGFSDPLIECKNCHRRFRADHLIGEDIWNREKDSIDMLNDDEKEKKVREIAGKCPNCGADALGSIRSFNLMFKTSLGPIDDEGSKVYLRPETAQGMFVNFKNIIGSSRKTLPFGIAQMGKAFRNEITPGNFIFRTREFEQMEIEYFIRPPKDDKEWQKVFEEWRVAMRNWISLLGISDENLYEVDIPNEELAHYSKKTIDFEYKFPFGVKELYGLAYRTDFDLKSHQESSGENMRYRDPLTKEEFWPHVIEPSFGVERTIMAVLSEAYEEEDVSEGEKRILMKFPPWLAPIKIAILPLVRNNAELIAKAKEIYEEVKKDFICDYDESGTIGRRYRRQDEIGTPFAVTIDFDTLDDDRVTIRERDTMKQERVKVVDLLNHIKEKIDG